MTVASFSGEKKGIPDGWRASRGDISMYSIKREDSNSFVSIATTGGCTSIGKQYKFSPEKYPLLRWSWRVHALPLNGNETVRKLNDSGAGVYVIFKGPFKMNPILKYVWSSTLKPGTVTHSPFNKNTKVLVLEQGLEKSGVWVSETVNVYSDYLRLFGSAPPEIEGIAILSDSDNTHSYASADYGTIVLMPAGGDKP